MGAPDSAAIERDVVARVALEPIERAREFADRGRFDRDLVARSLSTALARISAALPTFTDAFPGPSSRQGIYPAIANVEWTNGFWTGMLWLAYEHTGDARFRDAALRQALSFERRVEERINADHHDLGFLYTLSCVAAWKIARDEAARDAALKAADLLLLRYLPCAGVIQAWGDLSDPAQAGRMIIDCNLNLPLLYWASETTGDPDHARAADRHIAQAARYLVRPDASTYHTFYMDPLTGAPKHGSTHQGHSDESCWARGQAWALAGFPLIYRYRRDPNLVELGARLGNYFLNRLPDDCVCCWDLAFSGPPHERDSSAASIAACGFLEIEQALPAEHPHRETYRCAALAIMNSLMRDYACRPNDSGSALLKHAVYHMPDRVGVNESCIWGDYFYFEALTRLTCIWGSYW